MHNGLRTQNYYRDDDYDLEGAEWRSARTIGSTYDQEFDCRSGDWRHRDWAKLGPWKKGMAPK